MPEKAFGVLIGLCRVVVPGLDEALKKAGWNPPMVRRR